MLSFHDYLKAFLPEGQMWDPVEADILCPTPDLRDGDAEAIGVADWFVGNGASVTKSTTAYEGSQSLEITPDGQKDPYAYQPILTIGCTYRIQGWAKGSTDSPLTLRVRDGDNYVWSESATSEWLEIDEEFTAQTEILGFGSNALAAQTSLWARFDALVLTVVMPESDAHFDLMLHAMGEHWELQPYEFLKDLAYIRNPYKTPYLSDLEKEYGVITSSDLTETQRREQLAAVVYAKRGTGSWDDLEDALNLAGFGVEVRTNDPALNPNLTGLAIHELIANDTDLDFWARYLDGLSDEERWNFLFWICETSTGWPYAYGDIIHELKNAGTLLYYNDFFVESFRDFSKYRYEDVAGTDVALSTDGATFGPAGRVQVDDAPRFSAIEGTLVWTGPFNSHTSGEVYFSKRDGVFTSLEVRLATGPSRIIVDDGVSPVSINFDIASILPTSIAVNYKLGSTPTLWINGALQGSFSGTIFPGFTIQDWYIGNDYTFGNPIQSKLETFLWFDKELDSTEHSALFAVLSALEAPAVTYPTLSAAQKAALRNIVVKFKPLRTIGLLAQEDKKFTFTNAAGYPGDPDLGFSSVKRMDGGRLIRAEEF